MANVPTQTSPVFCTDEDILVYAGGDFAALTPPWQQMAAGADGVFAPAARWVLSSASVDFVGQAVAPNMVIWLTAPKANFPGAGQFFAIDSVAAGGLTLRRVYQALSAGQPPAPAAGLTAVAFTVPTLGPQIEEASYDLKQRYAIDDNLLIGPYRSSSWIYDLQVLRKATVYSVLVERYTQEQREDRGDFKIKADRYRGKRDRAIDLLQVRWGPYGNSAEPATVFSCKISR